METYQLDYLKFADYNPRQITKSDFEALQKSMSTFGDLSCIVKNVRTGNLVAGHQRIRAMLQLFGKDTEVVIEARNEAPDMYGTIAIGYVKVKDTALRFPYREVDWKSEIEMTANVAANRISGDWDLEKLADVNELIKQADADLLALTGQTDDELAKLAQLGSAPEDDSKRDDSRIPMNFKMTDDQSIVVDQAITEISARLVLGNDDNDDLRANAIVQICHAYLASLNDDQPKDQPADNPDTTTTE